MQLESERRTNTQRTEETKRALIAAARGLFIEQGFAETGTPEIVKSAKVTRGALYHHYEDKTDLFRAVLWAEARAVASEIGSRTSTDMAPVDAIVSGAEAYFDAMRVPGRTRLLLIDGPAVLGPAEMHRIDQQTGGEELRQGLRYLKDHDQTALPVEAGANLLSALFDRAALAIAEGEDETTYRNAMIQILNGILKR